MLIIAVTFVPHEQYRASFLEAVSHNAQRSLEQEAGCLRFDVCTNEDGSEVFLYEQYVDDNAFDEVHLKSLHFLDFNEMTSAWIADKKVCRYQLVSK